jgi:hypothetical protein
MLDALYSATGYFAHAARHARNLELFSPYVRQMFAIAIKEQNPGTGWLVG